MKKFFSIVLFVVLSSQLVFGQGKHPLFDDKMDEICALVESLHASPECYMEVYEALRVRDYWRLMEEFHENCETVGNMCSLWDKVDFTGINDRAFQAEQARGTRPQSTDNFCAGSETRYHYSFYECKVLAGCTVDSFISGRQGQQLLVVVPYNPGTLHIDVSVNGKAVQSEQTSDGYIECFISDDLTVNDEIVIKVVNDSDINQSVVIINHNSCN